MQPVPAQAAPAAETAPCPAENPSSRALLDTSHTVVAALLAFDLPGGAPRRDDLLVALRCTRDVLTGSVLADTFRTLGTMGWVEGDQAGALQFFQAARSLEPNAVLAAEVVDRWPHMGELYEAAGQPPPVSSEPLSPPPGMVINVNGSIGSVRPKNLPVVLQYSQGRLVVWSGYVAAGEELPRDLPVNRSQKFDASIDWIFRTIFFEVEGGISIRPSDVEETDVVVWSSEYLSLDDDDRVDCGLGCTVYSDDAHNVYGTHPRGRLSLGGHIGPLDIVASAGITTRRYWVRNFWMAVSGDDLSHPDTVDDSGEYERQYPLTVFEPGIMVRVSPFRGVGLRPLISLGLDVSYAIGSGNAGLTLGSPGFTHRGNEMNYGDGTSAPLYSRGLAPLLTGSLGAAVEYRRDRGLTPFLRVEISASGSPGYDSSSDYSDLDLSGFAWEDDKVLYNRASQNYDEVVGGAAVLGLRWDPL